MFEKIKTSTPYIRVVAIAATTVNATISFIVHYSLIVATLVGAGAFLAHWFNYGPRLADAAIAGLLAFAATKVIAWQLAFETNARPAGKASIRALRVKSWSNPRHAMRLFCDPVSWKKRTETHQAASEAEDKYSESILQAPMHGMPPGQPHEEFANRQALKNAYYVAEGRCNWEITNKLATGELLGKGLVAPYVAGAQEVIIPQHEWRILVLSADEATAAGRGIKYEGIVIGKPT